MPLQDRDLPLAGDTTLREDSDVDAPVAEAKHENEARDPRAVWPGIVSRVRRGDPKAAADFRTLCRPGVRLILKLNLSAVGLDRIVEETIAGALEEVRRGWIREPRDLSAFVRTVIERLSPESPRGGASDQAKARARARDLEIALNAFEPAERIWLRRFYIDGWDSLRISLSSGISIEEFAGLRRRLRIEAGLLGVLPASGTLRVRRASAGNRS